jgi:hypothetical protein
MKQQTVTGFERYAKDERSARLLEEMQVIVPWEELAAVEPLSPKISEASGRPQLPLERMLMCTFYEARVDSRGQVRIGSGYR